MIATPNKRKEYSRNNSKTVEGKLEKIRQSASLAIHCYEDEKPKDEPLLFPQQTLADLDKNMGASVADKDDAGNYKAPTPSLTLLPAGNKSTNVYEDYRCPIGYLFDLSQDIDNPAAVIRVFPTSGVTGNNNFHKKLRLGTDRAESASLHTFADIIYKKYDGLDPKEAEEQFRKNIVTFPTLSSLQLATLADAQANYCDPHIPYYNEVLASVRKQHIEAIAVPYVDAKERSNFSKEPTHKSYAILKGVLSAIEHLNHGIDLPVVIYNIQGPHNGQCSYVAQGLKECREEAIKAIADLQATTDFRFTSDFCIACDRLLNIDVCKPIDEQIGRAK